MAPSGLEIRSVLLVSNRRQKSFQTLMLNSMRIEYLHLMVPYAHQQVQQGQQTNQNKNGVCYFF